MARRVFYSFDYQRDSWRASMVRNIGMVLGNQAAIDNAWEEVYKSEDSAIRRWIKKQLNGRSCTIVLIGAETARSKWVRYEIEQTLLSGKGLLGIRIHKLLDQKQQEDMAGPDPFEGLSMPDGRLVTDVIHTYDPPGETSKEVYAHISEHIESWIEIAIAER
ncbi:MAG TPA: TIR domain-containing protein [Methylophilus sp.]|uniref:TIR domain-containing protein n=1 Tax=Methylophilus sp. TaxID=29541 RepID=UPI002C57C735|nr:TIR domain-containing protein [Methylophilus sp.]HSH87201.1 TIR domain-containing protein [Methylophilus sp.]